MNTTKISRISKFICRELENNFRLKLEAHNILNELETNADKETRDKLTTLHYIINNFDDHTNFAPNYLSNLIYGKGSIWW